ncbi:hypothetical protein [Microbacterium sp.]|uniref:hypothetical protein n=1 Tax=Microbacterium sp. TaxID=51671 RepID=UPI002810A01C|nr:hypothetical protein [Microbacterium sp.]
MSETRDRLNAFGVVCRRADAGTWRYVSVAPWPQLSEAGIPMIGLLSTGEVSFLQLSVQLDPPGWMLEQLRAALARDGDTAGITLVSGVSAVHAVEVAVGRTPQRRVVGRSGGSGYPPYTAVLSIPAGADDRAAFEGALRGEHGRLSVAYLAETDDGPATIAADVADWTRLH